MKKTSFLLISLLAAALAIPAFSAAPSSAASPANPPQVEKSVDALSLMTHDGFAADFEGSSLALSKDGQVFAETTVDPAEIADVFSRGSCVGFVMKDGRKITISTANTKFGFITIDYAHVGEATLGNEEPLSWRLPGVDPDQPGGIKAFGTAGLREIDGHNGSYAFLAIVAPQTRAGVVGGWLTSEKAGGVIRSEKTKTGRAMMIPRLDYGKFETKGRELSERFVIGSFSDCREGLENYANAIADHYNITLNTKNLTGYCTWYADKNGGSCNEKALVELADAAKKYFGAYGFNFVQIDDGWQLGASKNGPNKNFTGHNPDGPYASGMKATSDAMAQRGFTTGLWFMPFSGNYDDPYFEDKQDFFVRSAIDYPENGEKNTRRYPSIDQHKGAPYETFWGGTCLDMSNPKVRDYVTFVADRVTQEWNCKYIKIDGTWCASGLEQLYVNDEYVPDDMGLQIFHDPNTTNIENFRVGLETLRAAAKETFILGCNVSQNMRTLATAYGLVDAMRVGPDNGADWDGVCSGPWRGTNRYFYNARVWFNDPDPVYVRNSIPLERARVSASWTGLTGQLYALSDWIPDYAPERVDVVRKTIPNHMRRGVRPVDLFDADFPTTWLLTDAQGGVRRDVVGLFNWKGGDDESFEFSPEKLGLPTTDDAGNPVKEYVGYDFWADEFIQPFSVLSRKLPKESCQILAIRPVGAAPVLLSTSRHITQGVLEVSHEGWDPDERVLVVEADVPEDMPYELRIYNPETKALERFAAPDGLAGHCVFRYRPDAEGDARFTAEPAQTAVF